MGKKRIGVSVGSESSVTLTFRYQERTVKERIKTRGKPTSADLDAAFQKRQQIKYAIKDGSFDFASTFPDSKKHHWFTLGGSTKFKPFLTRYHKKHLADDDLADSTENTNTGIVNRLNDKLGKLYLSQITKEVIEKFFDEKRLENGKKISTKTINNYLAVLRPALQDAVNSNLLSKNPLDNVIITGSKSKAKEAIEPYSHYEMNAILNSCKGQLHNIFKFAFWTGLRPSELIELKYSDIDNGKIYVARKRTAYSKSPEGLKTKASYRSIKLLPDALAAIENQKQYTFDLQQHIFHNPNTNKPWHSPKIYREAWVRTLNKTDIKYRYPYQTRHTFATMMLSAGENLLWVSNAMGHESTKETLDTYSRWIQDNDSDVGMKAAQKFKFEQKIAN
jgi:integrase